jgi:Zn-dependent peptidase ImmA (M78 family)
MANYVNGVNPKLLQWARIQSGYSLDEVATVLKKSVDIIESWEYGESVPTYGELEKLAYQLYKRPLAIFFFPEPPEETDPRQSFRTLPDFEIDNLVPDTLYAIRQAKAMQIALSDLNNGVNPSDLKLLHDVRIDAKSDVALAANRLREYLGVDLKVQIGWRNPTEALENWREIIQERGIFVFKRAFKQEDVSGFCLLDDEFPMIYLNNSAAITRQIFTIFHELSHLMLNANGITKQDDRYIDSLVGHAREIEVFCNRFAAELLVPSSDFEFLLSIGLSNQTPVDYLVDDLADRYKVSREVILRKLLDRGMIDRDGLRSIGEFEAGDVVGITMPRRLLIWVKNISIWRLVGITKGG